MCMRHSPHQLSTCDGEKLVGEWLSGCSIDICAVTTLNADHTFSDRFDDKDFSEPSYSGTWHVENDQLVMHVTWANKAQQDIIGEDLRLIVSEFHQRKFVATLAEDGIKPVAWERRH